MKPGREFFLEAGLFVFILLAPLSFGAVYPWGAMSLAALLFFLFIFFPDPPAALLDLPGFFTVGILFIFLALAVEFFLSPAGRYITAIELVKWLACVCGFVIVQGLEKESVCRLMGFFFLLGAAESLYGMAEVFSGREHVLWQAKEAYRGFVTGTYINRNHLAGFLEMSLGIGLGFLFAPVEEQKWGRFFGLSLCLTILLTGLLKTGSLMGLTSVLMVLFIFSSMLLLRSRGLLGLSVFVLWIGFLGGAAFFLGRDILFSRLMDLDVRGESLQGRFSVWQDALKIIGSHFWRGTGLGTYEWVFPVYQSEKILMGWEHAHNDYLELAIELGFPLFLLLIFCFLALWFYCIQRLFGLSNERIFSVAWGGFMGLSAFAIHGLADFNLAIPANHYLFILLLGMVVRLLQEEYAKI